MTQMIAVRVPDFGDVPALEVSSGVGDAVRIDDPVILPETDKATRDGPSRHAGSVAEVKGKAGDTVSQGDLFTVIRVDANETPAESEPASARDLAPERSEEEAQGPALSRDAIVIPHMTNFDKADVTDLEAFRKTLNDERAPMRRSAPC